MPRPRHRRRTRMTAGKGEEEAASTASTGARPRHGPRLEARAGGLACLPPPLPLHLLATDLAPCLTNTARHGLAFQKSWPKAAGTARSTRLAAHEARRYPTPRPHSIAPYLSPSTSLHLLLSHAHPIFYFSHPHTHTHSATYHDAPARHPHPLPYRATPLIARRRRRRRQPPPLDSPTQPPSTSTHQTHRARPAARVQSHARSRPTRGLAAVEQRPNQIAAVEVRGRPRPLPPAANAPAPTSSTRRPALSASPPLSPRKTLSRPPPLFPPRICIYIHMYVPGTLRHVRICVCRLASSQQATCKLQPTASASASQRTWGKRPSRGTRPVSNDTHLSGRRWNSPPPPLHKRPPLSAVSQGA
ncbi:hypothetical protein CDD83_2006 [Cordyceps sp. RAO-2017]|nr:hypothetical protein CDD83_2006 [Cordyceps sp. RAO-2017]